MGSRENTETFNQWIEAHRAHDLDALVTFLTDDITIQSAAGADMPPAKGKDEARHHWQTIYDAFPDMRMDLVDLTSEGDTLFAEISHGGTMEGAMGPRQPKTSKRFKPPLKRSSTPRSSSTQIAKPTGTPQRAAPNGTYALSWRRAGERPHIATGGAFRCGP